MCVFGLTFLPRHILSIYCNSKSKYKVHVCVIYTLCTQPEDNLNNSVHNLKGGGVKISICATMSMVKPVWV